MHGFVYSWTEGAQMFHSKGKPTAVCNRAGDWPCPSPVPRHFNIVQPLIFHTKLIDSSSDTGKLYHADQVHSLPCQIKCLLYFSHNYVRLSPEIHILCSPTFLSNEDEVCMVPPKSSVHLGCVNLVSIKTQGSNSTEHSATQPI